MKGTYLLILFLEHDLAELSIGKLGRFHFDPGYYLYIGSAMGSGGLDARLRHHLRRHKPRNHWHIDYLRPYTRIVESWAVGTSFRLECRWCQTLQSLPGLTIPIPHFGASDRNCPGHLFFSSRRPTPPSLVRSLFASLPTPDLAELTLDINSYDDIA